VLLVVGLPSPIPFFVRPSKVFSSSEILQFVFCRRQLHARQKRVGVAHGTARRDATSVRQIVHQRLRAVSVDARTDDGIAPVVVKVALPAVIPDRGPGDVIVRVVEVDRIHILGWLLRNGIQDPFRQCLCQLNTLTLILYIR